MYYITYNGNCVGPMSAAQVAAYPVNDNTPVSTDGANWRPLYTYPELMQARTAPSSSVTSTRVVAGLCAILVGTLGVQYFIIGKTKAGLITILLSLVTCGLWGILCVVQGILMLLMSDQEFEEKYVNSTATLPLF